MRNLKKILALVLSLAMIMSMTAFAGFADADKVDADYAEAVTVLNGMGVFKGYKDGSFKPQGEITRAEVAAIVYRIATADVDDDYVDLWTGTAKFSDVNDAAWYAGYVGFCASNGYVQGYPDGTFKPEAKVTGFEVLAMILRVNGYDAEKEFSGIKWSDNIAKVATQNDILEDVKPGALAKAAPREMVAQLLFGALNAPTVNYTLLNGYTKNKTTLGGEKFGLKLNEDVENDDFGRPAYSWTYKTGDKKTVFAYEPLASYTVATKECDIMADTDLDKGDKLDVYLNGEKDGKYEIKDKTSKYGEQGRLLEFYEDRVIVIDTFLAEVTKVVAEKTDSRGHVTDAYVEAKVYMNGDDTTTTLKFETDEFAKGDMVLVTIADDEIASMEIAESDIQKLTKVEGSSKTITDIQKIITLDKEDVTINHTADLEPEMTLADNYTFYYDTYGNVIGAEALSTNYAVVDSLYSTHIDGDDAAIADIVFFDATMKEDITVKSIDYDKAEDFSERKKLNTEYYYTVYEYAEEDGEYELTTADFITAQSAEYRAGYPYMYIDGEPVQISKSTTILMQTKESPAGEYKALTGYKGLPSFEGGNVAYTLDGGYIDMMYVCAAELSERTVFIYDIAPSTAAVTEFDGIYVAEVEALELIDGELEEVTIDVLFQDEYGEMEWNTIDRIGLYDIVENEKYGFWYAVESYEAYGVDAITDDGLRVLIDGYYENLDDAIVVQYEGSFEHGDYEDDYSAEDLNMESIVFVQYDEDDNVVVVYDMYIKLDVVFADKAGRDENTAVYKDAKIKSAPALYFGKTTSGKIVVEVPAYVDVDKAWSIDRMGDNDLWKNSFTYSDTDKHNVKAEIEITTEEKLFGDVVIFLVEDPAHTSTWLVAKEPAINVNMTVSVEGSVVTVVGTNPTVKVNDLLAWLSTECEYATMKLYDNTGANEVTSGDVDFKNMCIVVTAEDGTVKTYTLVLIPAEL